jgi:methanogenic corrinoid protein MtbC1
VSTGLHLSEYATTPLYNIKAVVQTTGISPSTLRAWERRYNVARPHRSDSGYRLYSERDIAIIRWLKAQVDVGMSISQAVHWLENIVGESGDTEGTILPSNGSAAPVPELHALGSLQRDQVRDLHSLQADLIHALTTYNEAEAETVVAEAFALYPVEQVGEELFTPVLVEIGERWHRGDLSITTEHFATNYLIQRLGTLLRSIPNSTSAPLIWVGCAPGEMHEVGALLLGIYLRRAGFQIHYLGQNLPLDDFAGEAKRRQPAMILFSASAVHSAEELAKLTTRLANHDQATPLIGYGGKIFERRPELRNGIAGIYMGATARAAVEQINELLLDKPRPAKNITDPSA